MKEAEDGRIGPKVVCMTRHHQMSQETMGFCEERLNVIFSFKKKKVKKKTPSNLIKKISVNKSFKFCKYKNKCVCI